MKIPAFPRGWPSWIAIYAGVASLGGILMLLIGFSLIVVGSLYASPEAAQDSVKVSGLAIAMLAAGIPLSVLSRNIEV